MIDASLYNLLLTGDGVAIIQYRCHFSTSLYDKILRYERETRCYFNVHSKADMSQLNLPHGTDN